MDEYSGLRVLRKTYPGLRELKIDERGSRAFDAYFADFEQQLADPKVDRNELVRQTLAEIHLGDRAASWKERVESPKTPLAERAHLLSFDPRNITLEPEYYAELDVAKYAPRKPLIWLWKALDLTPLGNNLAFGFRMRRTIAQHVFKRCGKNLKLFTGVEITYGYNISVGDNVTVHRNVLLDDRGEIIIHDGCSLSDYVNVYSHSHDIVDPNDIDLGLTEIGPLARVTYHSTVLSGTRIGPNSMLGACGLATKPVRPYHVHVGIPAKSVRVKPNAPPEIAGTQAPKAKPGERPTI